MYVCLFISHFREACRMDPSIEFCSDNNNFLLSLWLFSQPSNCFAPAKPGKDAWHSIGVEKGGSRCATYKWDESKQDSNSLATTGLIQSDKSATSQQPWIPSVPNIEVIPNLLFKPTWDLVTSKQIGTILFPNEVNKNDFKNTFYTLACLDSRQGVDN